MASFTDRMIRAAKLDVALYEEVEADKGAMGQAMGVVILSSVAAGIGTISVTGINGLIFGTIAALLGWFIWAFLTYYIGVCFIGWIVQTVIFALFFWFAGGFGASQA